MNIFVLDMDVSACARFHSDRHVVRMTLESAQILCTVLHGLGVPAPYRPTHEMHPCALWAGRSLSNWIWLRRLGMALNREYRYRFRRSEDHAAGTVIRNLPLPAMPDHGITEFAQAMPAGFRVPGDAVAAYRRYYSVEKSRSATWTRRRKPFWLVESDERSLPVRS